MFVSLLNNVILYCNYGIVKQEINQRSNYSTAAKQASNPQQSAVQQYSNYCTVISTPQLQQTNITNLQIKRAIHSAAVQQCSKIVLQCSQANRSKSIAN